MVIANWTDRLWFVRFNLGAGISLGLGLGSVLVLELISTTARAQTHAETPAVQVATSPCPPALKAAALEGTLPRLRARLRAKRSLTIVALGSSSTAGAGASKADGSYPRQLERALKFQMPEREIVVLNAGVNGQEAPDMLARLEQDVIRLAPDLVIWQFGSNGLLRGRTVDSMEATVRAGIERIHAIGADVLLLDLQRAPRIDALPERDQVLEMTRRVALNSSAALFHRYRLMAGWSDSLGEGYSQMVHEDQLHMTDQSYRCMARVLADSLVAAVRD
jgi:acyl-CoA thioesterase I